MSEDKKKECMPVTDAILAVIGDEKPNWIIAPLNEIEQLAKENGINVKDLNLTPLEIFRKKK